MEDGWERPPRVIVSRDELGELVSPAFAGRQVVESSTIQTGLANTNIRFRVAADPRSYVLRLNTRDGAAAAREVAVVRHLTASRLVPAPELIYADTVPLRGEHPYSIWELVEGELLQHLFESLSGPELVRIAAECGRVLAALTSFSFDTCGELGSDLRVAKEYGRPSRFVPEAIHRALFDGKAGERLGSEVRTGLWRVVERWSSELTSIDDRNTLVHADYKRSNLVMRRVAGAWKLAAVLDWEFACAGPALIDVGLFLRAGAQLPEGFRDAFVGGYVEAGGTLPRDWLPLSRLVDLVSQMTFLDDQRDRPRVYAETRAVVLETVRMLS